MEERSAFGLLAYTLEGYGVKGESKEKGDAGELGDRSESGNW